MKKVIVAIATLCLTLPVSAFAMTLGGIQFGTGDYDGVICMPYTCDFVAGTETTYLYDITADTFYGGADCKDGASPQGGQGGNAGLVGACNNTWGFTYQLGHQYSLIEAAGNFEYGSPCEEPEVLDYAACKLTDGYAGEATFIYSGMPPELLSYMTLPESAGTDLFATIGNITSGIWVLISLAIGIPLAFYLIDLIISLLSIDNETRETRIQSQDRYNVSFTDNDEDDDEVLLKVGEK
jgi:hypothetical protein